MIEITDVAVERLKSLGHTQIRVSVQGGGCSGLTYKLEADPNPPAENDKAFTKDGITVLVDPRSYLFLAGSTLDHGTGLSSVGFFFNNPNAARTCGCGSS